MPAPTGHQYDAASLVAAHTAFLGLIDAGSSAGYIALRSEADVLLATVPLTDPAGTVNGTTGQLTLTASGPDLGADADGVCTYGQICDSDDNVRLALPAQSGASAVSGKLVLNTTSIVQGAEVSLISAVIG
ncbi:MAG TPA: hypothetical protein VIC02_05475 [Kineobactrum sp.]